MTDTKNALAELANELTWIEDILRSEGYDSYCDEANKAKRIVAELAKVRINSLGGPYDENETYAAISNCREIAEEGV